MAYDSKNGKDTASDADLLAKAKKCLKTAQDAEARQRERERDDLRFQVPEYQWDEDAKKQRRGGVDTSSGVLTPARPMLSISLLHQPMQLVQNQAQVAKLGVNIHPVSEDADKDLAEVKQGLYRRIERDSNAEQARLWALDRAKQCGRGWYRVNTQYDDDGDDEFDQEIVIERILYQDMVYMDPGATKPDFSDAQWGMIVAWVPIEQFREMYPKASVGFEGTDLAGYAREEPNWVRSGGEQRAVLVAEYFYKEYERREVTRPIADKDAVLKRTIEKPIVQWCTLTCAEVLSRQTWNGKYIPIVPVIGKELQPFDDERRWEGMVRPARDGQKLYNYAASSMVESMASEPKVPFIGTAKQFEGYEDEWQAANVRNMPFMRYNPDGEAPPPQRAQVDGSKMSLAIQALNEGRQFVQQATAVYEPSLGEAPRRRDAQSGRAIMALQQQADAGTSNYIQNLARVSMRYEAMVVLDLMPAIYDRPGRVTQVLGNEEDEKMVMLGAPFVMGPDGRPQSAEGHPEAKVYDLSKGKYSISISVGRSHQTRLQQGAEEMGEFITAMPQIGPVLLPTYLKFRDFPGAREAAEALGKIRDQQFPGLFKDEPGESLETVKAERDQLRQQTQMLGQQLQQAAQAIQTDQVKQQATLAKAQIDQETQITKAQIDQETKLMLADIQNRLKMLEGQAQRGHEAVEGQEDRAHETALEAQKGAFKLAEADLNYRQSAADRALSGEQDQL